MATAGLGIAKEPNKGIYQAMMNGQDIMDCIQGTELDNLLSLPLLARAGRGRSRALLLRKTGSTGSGRRLDPVRPRFNFILIDCPPSLGFLTINALTAADSDPDPRPDRIFLHGGDPRSSPYPERGPDLFQSRP